MRESFAPPFPYFVGSYRRGGRLPSFPKHFPQISSKFSPLILSGDSCPPPFGFEVPRPKVMPPILWTAPFSQKMHSVKPRIEATSPLSLDLAPFPDSRYRETCPFRPCLFFSPALQIYSRTFAREFSPLLIRAWSM